MIFVHWTTIPKLFFGGLLVGSAIGFFLGWLVTGGY